MNFRKLLTLWKVSRSRLDSESDYSKFQSFQASLLIDYLNSHGISIVGKKLLDLGSGIGGYSQEFARNRAQVLSIDVFHPISPNSKNLTLVKASAMKIPLAHETIDIIFCASLIEHLAEPADLLSESSRVLKRNGFCYISFPPYYSPRGGHEFSPFHYLGEGMALRLSKRARKKPEWAKNFYNAPQEINTFASSYDGWGLHRMTIRKFRRLSKNTNLKITNSSARYLPFSFVRWPILGEILTWHAQFLLQKQNDQDQMTI